MNLSGYLSHPNDKHFRKSVLTSTREFNSDIAKCAFRSIILPAHSDYLIVNFALTLDEDWKS